MMERDPRLVEIHRLLVEAYDHYFTYEGHYKSGEAIVSLHYPNYWELSDGATEPSVEVYSYVLGPHRSHYFKDLDEALAEVARWHAAELSFDYEKSSLG